MISASVAIQKGLTNDTWLPEFLLQVLAPQELGGHVSEQRRQPLPKAPCEGAETHQRDAGEREEDLKKPVCG